MDLSLAEVDLSLAEVDLTRAEVDMVADQLDMVAEVDMVVEVDMVAEGDLVAQAGLVITRARATSPMVELTEVRLQPPGSTDPCSSSRRGFSQERIFACTVLILKPIWVPPVHGRGTLRQCGRSH